MTTVLADHASIERLLRPASNRADQCRANPGRVDAKRVRHREGAYATNGPESWPDIHHRMRSGMHEDELLAIASQAFRDAIACRDQVLATRIHRVTSRGVVTIPLLLADGFRYTPVFLYADATDATARHFAHARDLCAMLGMDEAVYFAPRPLNRAIGAGAEEPLGFAHFQPATSHGDTRRSTVWGEPDERAAIHAAWAAFDKALGRRAADFAACLFERGHGGRLRGMRLPTHLVGTWLEAPDRIVVSAIASRRDGVRLEFPEDTKVPVALSIIHGLTQLAEDFRTEDRFPRIFGRSAAHDSAPQPRSNPAPPPQVPPRSPAPIASPTPTRPAPARPSTAIAKARRVAPPLSMPTGPATPSGAPQPSADIVPNAARFDRAAREALAVDDAPDQANVRRLPPAARFTPDGFLIPPSGKVPTPGEFTLTPEDHAFIDEPRL